MVRDKNGQPLYSWRVLLLASSTSNKNALYRQFKLDEPWDSSPRTNKTLLGAGCPRFIARLSEEPAILLALSPVIRFFVGPGTVFEH